MLYNRRSKLNGAREKKSYHFVRMENTSKE